MRARNILAFLVAILAVGLVCQVITLVQQTSSREVATPDDVVVLLHTGIDAGPNTPILPVDISRGLSTSPYYQEDISPLFVGADLLATSSGPNATFFTLTQTSNGPQPLTPLNVDWGSGSLAIDSGGITGLPGINVFATAGQSCTTIASGFQANVGTYINSHRKVLVIEPSCALNEGTTAAVACADIQSLVSTAKNSATDAGVSTPHIYVTTMLDSPAVSAGYVATINTCLRGVSWSGAALLDVANDHDPVTDAGPFLGLAAGSTGTSCSTERRCWFGDGGADGTALTMQGAMRWADVVTTLVRAGGYQ